MQTEKLLEVVKIQADILEKFGVRIMNDMPQTPEREEIRQLLEIMKDRLEDL
jgi:hypothetical protein